MGVAGMWGQQGHGDGGTWRQTWGQWGHEDRRGDSGDMETAGTWIQIWGQQGPGDSRDNSHQPHLQEPPAPLSIPPCAWRAGGCEMEPSGTPTLIAAPSPNL